MAVKGKGVFRLAIEDFFTTTRIGLWISGWVKDIGEWFEDIIASHYADILGDLLKDTNMPESIKDIARGSQGGQKQGGMAQALSFAVGTGWQASGSILAPLMKLGEYAANKKWKPARFDPQSAMALLWRDPNLAFKMVSDMVDLGWDEDRMKALALLFTPRPNEQTLIQGWLRGKVTKEGLVSELAKRGWEQSTIDLFITLSEVIPSVSDLISMAVREAFTPDVIRRWNYDEAFPSEILEHTRKQGLSDEWVKRYWYAHWQLPSPQMGFDMLHRLRNGRTSNPFTADDLDTLLKTADYPEYYRKRLAEISYSPFTRVDVRRMYKLGILTYDEVIEAYKDLGYDEVRAKQLADFTVNYEISDTTNLIDDYSELSRSLIQTAYKAGFIDQSEFRDALSGMGIVDKAQDLVVSITELKTQVDNIPDYTKEYRSDLKTIVEKAYTAKLIDKQSALSSLVSIGISPEQANMLLTNAEANYTYGSRSDAISMIGKLYIGFSIDRGLAISELGKHNVSGAEQAQILSEWDRARDYRDRKLTQAQYQKAWLSGLITDDEYRDNLRGLGYTEYDIELLILMQTSEGLEEG